MNATLTNGYFNTPPFFYFANAANAQTFVAGEAARIQVGPPNGAALLGNIPASSPLKMFAASDHANPIAEWTVSEDTTLSAYPVALAVQSCVSGGSVTVTGTGVPGDPYVVLFTIAAPIETLDGSADGLEEVQDYPCAYETPGGGGGGYTGSLTVLTAVTCNGDGTISVTSKVVTIADGLITGVT